MQSVKRNDDMGVKKKPVNFGVKDRELFGISPY